MWYDRDTIFSKSLAKDNGGVYSLVETVCLLNALSEQLQSYFQESHKINRDTR